jgi:hypothetical protein
MGTYFSSYDTPAVKTYCINSYGDCNLIIDYIEQGNDGEIIIHYKTIE